MGECDKEIKKYMMRPTSIEQAKQRVETIKKVEMGIKNMKAYTTSRIGNNGKKYVGVNINNRQFEAGVPRIGKTVKNVVKKVLTPIRNENIAKKKRDDMWRQQGEDMMAGRERYIPTNKKNK
jgi:hypothetical protein